MRSRIYTRTEKSQDLFHETNQDSRFYGTYFLMNDDRVTLLAVADGVSSAIDSHIASQNAVVGFAEAFHSGLIEAYASADDGFSVCHHFDRIKEIAVKSVIAANTKVCSSVDDFTPTGTTLSVVIILNNSLLCLNVGDSPVYYYSAVSDEFLLLSDIQTRAEADYREGKYQRYSAEYYKADHILTSALGNISSSNRAIFNAANIAIAEKESLFPGDRILLGSDGCFGQMKETEIWSIIRQSNSHIALKELFERARKDKNDDQTAILYCLDKEE